MVDRIYIASDKTTLEALLAIGHENSVLFDTTTRLEADEFVFCGTKAREHMEDFRASGVAPEILSWQDIPGAPIRHFHWDMIRRASEIEDIEVPTYLRCGITGLGKIVRWRYPELGIIAGPYGSGKSLFAQLIAQDFARQNEVPVSICAWEDQLEDIRDGLVRYSQTTTFRDAFVKLEEGTKLVDEVVRPHFSGSERAWLDMFHLAIADPTKDRFISDYTNLVAYQAKRYGCKFFILDPWNEFDHQRHSKQSETEYVREVMKGLRKVVDLHKIIVYIVTHIPGDLYSNDGSIKPFRIANSFGSSNFGAKADRGFCVLQATKWSDGQGSHMVIRQDKVKQANVYVKKGDKWKLKKEKMGKKATIALKYNWDNHSVYWDKAVSEAADLQGVWKG